MVFTKKLDQNKEALIVLDKALKLDREETLDWIETVKNMLGQILITTTNKVKQNTTLIFSV